MQSKFKLIFCGMLAILIAVWPPFGSPGQNTPPVADSIQQAKQIIRANVDTIQGINTFIKEKAKEVTEVRPVVPPQVYSSWLNRLIRSKSSISAPVKRKIDKPLSTPAMSEASEIASNIRPVVVYRECRPYQGTRPRGMTEKEYRDYRGPIYKILHPLKREKKN